MQTTNHSKMHICASKVQMSTLKLKQRTYVSQRFQPFTMEMTWILSGVLTALIICIHKNSTATQKVSPLQWVQCGSFLLELISNKETASLTSPCWQCVSWIIQGNQNYVSLFTSSQVHKQNCIHLFQGGGWHLRVSYKTKNCMDRYHYTTISFTV